MSRKQRKKGILKMICLCFLLFFSLGGGGGQVGRAGREVVLGQR